MIIKISITVTVNIYIFMVNYTSIIVVIQKIGLLFNKIIKKLKIELRGAHPRV